jgi:serine/threonine-protein kinase
MRWMAIGVLGKKRGAYCRGRDGAVQTPASATIARQGAGASAMRGLWAELGRRNVIRMALAYCALAWLLLQVAALLLPAFGVPGWVLRLLILLAALGFPFALLFSWGYAWTDAGVVRESPAPGTPAERPAAGPVAASIAVLPLVNMSSDREQDYFSDGLSEELLNLLAQVPDLHVAGRTSSFSFKGTATTIGEIGRALNVAHVLEGSVRKGGDRVRITVQLIRVRDDSHLWSQAYDRELTDIFAVQDEIAAAVVHALKPKLLPAQQPRHAGHHVPGTEAYHHFLLGRQFLNRATLDGYNRAVQEYRNAVALDPGYAAALAGLALAEAYASDNTATAAELEAGRARAAQAADRAVACDPNSGEPHTARAVLRFAFEQDWRGGEADFRKALECSPGDVMTRWQYSRLLAALGRLPEALAQARVATGLDPLSAQAWEIASRYEIALDDFAAAETSLRRALDIAPEHGRVPVGLGLLHLLLGDAAQAHAWYARADNEAFRLSGQAMAAHLAGDRASVQRMLDALVAEGAHTSAYQIGEVLAWCGRRDDAFAWLQRAVAQRDAGVQYLGYDPVLRPLHDDPRYPRMLREVGLRD